MVAESQGITTSDAEESHPPHTVIASRFYPKGHASIGVAILRIYRKRERAVVPPKVVVAI